MNVSMHARSFSILYCKIAVLCAMCDSWAWLAHVFWLGIVCGAQVCEACCLAGGITWRQCNGMDHAVLTLSELRCKGKPLLKT